VIQPIIQREKVMKNRYISILWLIPTLLLGIDIGYRVGPRLSLPIQAQQPNLAAGPSAIGLKPAADSVSVDINEAYRQFQPVNTIFQKVSRALSSSVVHITARKGDSETGEVEESGSGVIVASEHPGQYVMTNNHVVTKSKPRQIKIQLSDGRVITPERVWTDARADIAILQLPENSPELAPARLGNSDDVSVGTWVLALGSPFGLMHSVSQGIISARGRHEAELFQDGVENQDFLQTDAAINPGNSGGPLVNLKGEVVGINTAIASQGGGSEGVGFSIPINLARWIMDQLLTHGKVQRGAMGIDLDELPAHRAEQLGLQRPIGAIVTTVHPDSPAQQAGLKDKDVIIRFNNAEVKDLNHLINMVSMAPIGIPADVEVWRDGSAIRLKVRVGARDQVLSQMGDGIGRENALAEKRPGRPRRPEATSKIVPGPWGIAVSGLTTEVRERLANELEGDAAMVVGVDPESPLAKELEAGDLITAINGRKFGSPAALMNALEQAINEVPGDKGNESNRSIEIEVIRSRTVGPAQKFVLKVDL
jgi:serine protease Do